MRLRNHMSLTYSNIVGKLTCMTLAQMILGMIMRLMMMRTMNLTICQVAVARKDALFMQQVVMSEESLVLFSMS